MKRFILLAAAGLLAVGSVGCHCVPCTERYSDVVDAYAESEPHLDHCFSPCWDVTRWGRWDCPCCDSNCNCNRR